MTRRIAVFVSTREDGGLRVCSKDLPGLILSGRNSACVLSAIEPAARTLLAMKGEVVDNLRIDAHFSTLIPNDRAGQE